ncbi:MAG: hypothetical protein JO121_07225 [Deltaproteobacteria bacterium]|jgi:hypothetical protein|nr:hypothetical protein [Deltaproteobacteria bacterium]
MKLPVTCRTVAALVGLWFGLMSIVCASDTLAPGWDPNAFQGESTLEIMTVGAKEGEHWSRLWLVVIDGKLYVRLGDRSFERVQKNVASPYVQVKVAGKKFDRVRVEAAPGMAEKVAAAMADKYFLDVLVRHEPHPMTARLVAEPVSPP